MPSPHPKAPAPGTVLPPHYAGCFGCGDEQPNGLHLRVTVGTGLRIDAAFTVAEQHQGAPGLAHGGVLAAAFDEALGYLLWLLGTPAVTGRLETDYLLPVPVGTTLRIAAEVTGVAGRKIYTRAEGRLDDGRLASAAHGLFVAVPLSHFTDHGSGVPARHAGRLERAGSTYNP